MEINEKKIFSTHYIICNTDELGFCEYLLYFLNAGIKAPDR